MSIDQGSIIIILVVVGVIILLVYSQTKNDDGSKSCPPCPKQSCPKYGRDPNYIQVAAPPINVTVNPNLDPMGDPIKMQDDQFVRDNLIYPMKRPNREVLEQIARYMGESGYAYPTAGYPTGKPTGYPPWHNLTQPGFIDNPKMVGYLTKMDLTPYEDTQQSIPLFEMKSPRNANRYFYYIVDQKNRGDIGVKVVFENITVNGRSTRNADENGIDEIQNGDIIEGVQIYPGVKFKANIYRSSIFP